MVEFIEINTPEARKKRVENIKKILSNIFKDTALVQVAVVFNCPFVGQSTKYIDMLFLIRVPYRKGNYYKITIKDKHYWLNSLVFGVKEISDNAIITVDDTYLCSSDGLFDWKEAIRYDNIDFKIFGQEALADRHFQCPIYYWYRSESMIASFSNNRLSFGPTINLRSIVQTAAEDCVYGERIDCLPITTKDSPLKVIAQLLFDEAKMKTHPGLLTKAKLDLILKQEQPQYIKRICESHGKQLCIISGKPGTGKTLALLRVSNLIAQNHHVRFLTYNQLLVKEIKTTVRTIDPLSSSSNFSVRSLHQYFYILAKKMKLLEVITRDQLTLLMSLCRFRASIAYDMIKICQAKGIVVPTDPRSLAENANRPLDLADYEEVGFYLKEFHTRMSSNPEEELTVDAYCEKKEAKIKGLLESQAYVQNHDLILWIMSKIYEDPEHFNEQYNIRTDRDLVSLLYGENRKDDYDANYHVETEDKGFDPQIYIDNAKPFTNWFHTLIIDEAQDCTFEEKLILTKLKGPETIIVATGGADQLIRRAREQDWSRCNNRPVPYEGLTLYPTSYRQKGNLIEFVNLFCASYGIYSSIKIPPQTIGLGRVIIDIRDYDGYPEDLIKDLMKDGEMNGCTPCESMLFLLPHKDYTSVRSNNEQINISETLTVSITDDKQRSISSHINMESVKEWDGTPPNKSMLPLPSSDQTRLIYYDSCRGLEAWSVFCLNLDLFFKEKESCDDAQKYADEQRELFMTDEEKKKKYAAMWCYMAMTRPINTLIIRLKYKNDFSENLLSIAQRLPFVQVLGDSLYERPSNIIGSIAINDYPF